jgi:hypothetical protein
MPTVQSGKAKGRRLQQFVRDLILKLWPELEEGDVVSTSMGVTGADVILSPRALSLIPIQIECKARKTMAIYDFYRQAMAHGKREPVVVIKADRQKPLALVDAEYFFKLQRGVT